MTTNYYEKMQSGCLYHVYNRTNNDEIAFKQKENYDYFLEKTGHYLPECVDI